MHYKACKINLKCDNETLINVATESVLFVSMVYLLTGKTVRKKLQNFSGNTTDVHTFCHPWQKLQKETFS